MIRPAVRAAARSSALVARRRAFATATVGAGENEFLAKRAAVREHAIHTTALWRRISFFVCIPGIAVAALWTWKVESAHAEHKAHAHEHGEEDDRTVYPYMNMRIKPFPWGNQSLFFNPHVNIRAKDNSEE